MAKQPLNGILQHLRKAAAVQTYRDLSDRDLLERFVGARDEAAFTVLIERHGPMALGVCRRALPSYHDAEDACQATFLVLARKAASVRKKTSLGSWLHGVACRVAGNLKRDHVRRKNRERRVDGPTPCDPAIEVSWREAQAILDAELQQLPERYRAPLILCYLECLTRDEAAQQLGLTSASLHGRLQRARGALRERLTKRGLTLSAVMSAAALGANAAQAVLAPTFVVCSSKAAMLLAAGQPIADCAIATHVLALTQEVLNTMFLAKLKLGTAAVLCVGLVAALIGGSFTSLGFAQDGKPYPPAKALVVRPAKTESDLDFIRRISKDLRGTDPTPTEIHFFVASNDAGRRQKLIDLFIQERQEQQDKKQIEAQRAKLDAFRETRFRAVMELVEESAGLGTLQKEFYQELHAAREKGDLARITQAYLDRLIDFVKTNPRSQDGPDAMRQIALVYESQGKTVEAGAWRDKLLKVHGNPAPEEPRKGVTPPPSAELKGVIEKIDANDASLVSISIGSDAGLAQGHTLGVYRLEPTPMFLGMIRIIDVAPRKAVARRVRLPGGNLPANAPILRVGDSVTSSFTAPVEKEKK